MVCLRGAVDGYANDELRGWIVDLDEPDRPEAVWCRNAAGHSLAFGAFCLREDVCAALGVRGVFGFAVPGDLLAELGPRFSVYDRRGGLLHDGRDVRLRAEPVLGTGQRPDQPINLFIHIPKTAGTSLRQTLLRHSPPGETLLVYTGHNPGITETELACLPARQRDRMRWVYGHYFFGLHKHFSRPVRYMTFIREPMSRLRSNVLHHAANGTEFIIDGSSVRPSDVVNEALSGEFDNLITRMIAGVGQSEVPADRMSEAEVEIAVQNIRHHFHFVGHQARIEADVRTLQASLAPSLAQRPASLARDNATPARRAYDQAEMDAIDWRRVAHRNRFDIMLHARIEQLGLASRARPSGRWSAEAALAGPP